MESWKKKFTLNNLKDLLILIREAWYVNYKKDYGLKQASRTCYERLHTYLVKYSFLRTNGYSNLYLKSETKRKILLVEFVFDDIMFGGHDLL